MPIFMRVDGLMRDVSTTAALGGGPRVTVFDGRSGGGLLQSDLVEISRISLSPMEGGVEGRDPAAKFKMQQMIERASISRTPIKIYLCPSDPVSASGGPLRTRVPNNIRQMPLAAHNVPVIDIVVCDAAGSNGHHYRLRNVTVSQDRDSAPQRSRVTSLTVTFNG